MNHHKRPFGVNVIALFQILNGLVVGAGILLTDELTVSSSVSSLQTLTFSMGFVNIFIAGGLWLMRRWAWVATMIWTGVSLAIGLITYYQGTPNYFSMIFNVLIVLYLNQREVQLAFETRADMRRTKAEMLNE